MIAIWVMFFAIQDEITENIVGQLAPEIYSAENARFQRVPPQNLDAWECYVRAMHLYGQQSKQSSADALELLEQAITLDPGYAQGSGPLCPDTGLARHPAFGGI